MCIYIFFLLIYAEIFLCMNVHICNMIECTHTYIFLFSIGFKCPVCSKFVSSDEMDLHLVMCLTKPRITYNGKKEVS